MRAFLCTTSVPGAGGDGEPAGGRWESNPTLQEHVFARSQFSTLTLIFLDFESMSVYLLSTRKYHMNIGRTLPKDTPYHGDTLPFVFRYDWVQVEFSLPGKESL